MGIMRHGVGVTVPHDVGYSDTRPVRIDLKPATGSIGLNLEEALKLAGELIRRLAELDHSALVDVVSKEL